MPEQIKSIIDNLRGLGPKRLAMMGGAAAIIMAVVLTAAIYLNRPAYETLYVGLDRNDVGQIGAVLSEAGIRYDVSSDGTSVMVAAGKTGQARMLLAERGLPTSSNAGYELFDNVGSFGLTSFMQEVTRVRALEGEIARTIQSITGIKSARVHIVMPERASFRREEQAPTASVVIRADRAEGMKAALAIRHLVAAAVPRLQADKVTVLDATGELLAAGDDPNNSSVARSLTVERTVETQIEENIRRALAPYLGPENFRASVKADVNTDMRQIEETIFDPESRVERSVQIVRANDQSNQRQSAPPTTVQQNLPEEDLAATEGPASSEQRERREETTNYELNSKRVATVSNGYTVERLSIAVVVNRERLLAVLGENATPEQVADRIAEIEKVVASATGFDANRGDVINVSSVEFMEGLAGVEATEPGIMETLSRHLGTIINATAFIVVVFLLSWFGLRPLVAAVTKKEGADAMNFDDLQLSLPNPLDNLQLPDPLADADGLGMGIGYGGSPFPDNMADDIRFKLKPAPQDRLAQMVDLNEERSAMILRKWASEELAA
ncbi:MULTISPECIES: flagellar basal-body MS-ring/collar protein FliF [unclassified Aminobacter]|uniref:flagellar basal-body MS-ring/collar protein FliF n=1 Tax=unclassified Aminobacter TaxID=2644704 RepID=UPI000464DEA9|nr:MULTISPECIES: flagellar basal-body MS-ring/collar protein FliF [unclassified Aminobacter]TWH23413.1 flagellar M-ring protein FliF [Aminobacter sp. J15]